VMSDGLGDVGGAVYPQDAEGEVAERGHGAGAGVGADLGAVFVVGDLAHPVQAVFYGPVAADPGCEVGCGDLFGGQAGDRVHRFGGPFRAVQPPGFAGDLNGLAGVREHDPSGHRDAALLDTAVRAGDACPVLRPILPAQEPR